MTALVETMPGANTAPPVLLLQGTGGTNREILTFGRRLVPQSPLITVAGRVGTGQQRQYFRQTVAAPATPQHLMTEATWIRDQVRQVCAAHRWDSDKLIVVGYSNGAAMGSYGLQHGLFPGRLAVLLHPVALPGTYDQDLHGRKIWLSGGQRDPFVQAAAIRQMAADFTARGAQTTVTITGGTHNLTPGEVLVAHDWLAANLSVD